MPRVKRTVASLRRKWAKTNIAEHSMEMSVAMAAPFIPRPRTKMNIGAMAMLRSAPMIMVNIARTG